MGTMNKKTEMDKKDGDICQKKKRLTSERSLRLVFLRWYVYGSLIKGNMGRTKDELG